MSSSDSEDDLHKEIARMKKKLKKLSRRRRRRRSRHDDFESKRQRKENVDPVTEEVNIQSPTLDETSNPDNTPNLDNIPNLNNTPNLDNLPNPDQIPNLETPNLDEIPQALLVALGNEKPKEERYGPNINYLIASRWETILLNDSDEIKDILNGYKVPQNCPLLDAPELNAEVKVALTESARNRDDMLRSKQQQLGIALTCLGQGMTKILAGLDVPDALKMISDGTKLLASIHYKETNTRKQLLAPLLDKSFTKMAETIPRNQYLFGENLAEKIKNTKEIERSGLQLRKPKPPMFNRPGNWAGPSRQNSQQKNTMRGGQKRPQVQSQTKKTNQYQPPKKTLKRAPVNRPERDYQRARQRR